MMTHSLADFEQRRQAIAPGRAVLSKDVGHLQGGPGIHYLTRLVAAGLAGWSNLSSGLMVAATTRGETAA